MSFESTVYAMGKALTADELGRAALEAGWEIRFLNGAGRFLDDPRVLEPDLLGKGFVLIGWDKTDRKTTQQVAKAEKSRDKKAIDALGLSGKLGWFEFACARFSYSQFWKKHAGERKSFEASVSAEDLQAMKQAQLRYLFRCGTRPKHCGDFLVAIVEVVASATDGYVGE
jgi:hypothetical protein